MACFFLGGCSIYQAAMQSGPADLSGIGLGTPRSLSDFFISNVRYLVK
jgi:hypothetical protein